MDEPTAPDAPTASPLRRLLRLGAELLAMVLLGLILMEVVGRIRAPDLPELAPDFALNTLDGERIVLSELRGQVVILNFWATWCAPCRVEIPTFSRFAEANPDVLVLGIATDGSEAELRVAGPALGIRYPIARADAATVAAYGISTLPTTVIVDAEGRVHTAHSGIMLDPQLALAVARAR